MNYTEIQALAYGYLDRTDVETTARYDDFLRIVEAKVNRVLKTLKMTSRVTITTDINTDYYGLPDDFEGIRDIQINGGKDNNKVVTVEYRTPPQINELSNITYPGAGIYYSLIVNQLQIAPPQDAKVLELVYYKKVPPLSLTTLTNWLGDDNPDCYVFGLCTEIAAFTKDGEAAQIWDSRFKEALSEIENNDQDVRWGSGSALVIRTT